MKTITEQLSISKFDAVVNVSPMYIEDVAHISSTATGNRTNRLNMPTAAGSSIFSLSCLILVDPVSAVWRFGGKAYCAWHIGTENAITHRNFPRHVAKVWRWGWRQ